MALLLTPSIAEAVGGSYTIPGLNEKYFVADLAGASRLLFTLTAQEYTRNLGVNLFDARLLLTEKMAEQTNQYTNGRISYGYSYINFDSGFFFRGQFIMKNTRGLLDGKYFSSPKITYNPDQGLISSKRIFFIGKNTYTAKADYRYIIQVEQDTSHET